MRLQGFRAIVLASCLLLSVLVAPAVAQLRAVTYVSGLSSPVGFVQDPSDPAVQYIVEQTGRIRVVNRGLLHETPFLDLISPAPSMIVCCGEQGLLGLAFPPNYGTSGHFFVFFTRPDWNIVVARFTRSLDSRFIADRSSRVDLRWSTGNSYIGHTGASNHNGGAMAFGPDGMLYIAVGDGGGGGDPFGNGQNTTTLLGKILRVDVTSQAAHASANGFVIPAGNPGFTRPEIWSYGLRNPWRITFDLGTGGTGALVVGDVGQNAREEIDYEPANRPGRNYGWPYREGSIAYPAAPGTPPPGATFTSPLYDYPHGTGRTVIAGHVYRGAIFPEMQGRLIFGDYVSQQVWSVGLTVNGPTGEGTVTSGSLVNHTADISNGQTLGNLSSFGVDAQGEIYLVVRSRGVVLKFVRGRPTPPTNVRVVR